MLNVLKKNINEYTPLDQYVDCIADVLLHDCEQAAIKRFFDLELLLICANQKQQLSMFKGESRVSTFRACMMAEIYADCKRCNHNLIPADIETLNELTDWKAITQAAVGLDEQSIALVKEIISDPF